jgi:serine/threonine-protein kinase
MSAIFARVNPNIAQGHELTARELLDTASSTLSNIGDAELRATLLQQLGEAYRNIGAYLQSKNMLERALEQQRIVRDPNPALLARIMISLGRTQLALGDFNVAELNLLDAKRALRNPAEFESTHVQYLLAMGQLKMLRGDLEASKRRYLEAIGLSRSLGANAAADLCAALSELMGVYNWQADFGAAQRLAREAWPVFQRTLPETHPDSIAFQFQLGDMLMQMGQLDEASRVIERAVALSRTTDRVNDAVFFRSLCVLARLRVAQGRLAEAEEIFEESIRTAARALGESHFEVGVLYTAIATIHFRTGHFEKAQASLTKSLNILRQSLPSNHVYVASAEHWLGETLLKTGETTKAREALGFSLSALRETNAPAWYRARTESALGEVLVQADEKDEGARLLRSSYAVLLKERGPQDEATQLARARVEALERAQGDDVRVVVSSTKKTN